MIYAHLISIEMGVYNVKSCVFKLMGASCMSSKSSHTGQTHGNPELQFSSPTKSRNELPHKNSKIISFSASPSNRTELTIEKMPSSLPKFSLHPVTDSTNSIFKME